MFFFLSHELPGEYYQSRLILCVSKLGGGRLQNFTEDAFFFFFGSKHVRRIRPSHGLSLA